MRSKSGGAFSQAASGHEPYYLHHFQLEQTFYIIYKKEYAFELKACVLDWLVLKIM